MPDTDQPEGQQQSLAQEAPQGNPDQLANMERMQRKAYWKGEQQAERRLPQFTPRNPLAGQALQESDRIEEEIWAVEQEAEEEAAWAAEVAWRNEVQQQGMLDTQNPPTAEQPATIPEGVDVQGARESLARVNEWGGEMDDNAVDQFVIQVAGDMKYNQGQLLSERPRYEQKAEFYKWLRKMESWSRGEEDKQSRGRHPTPVPANELPEGQSIG
jgi:hypothetical protein